MSLKFKTANSMPQVVNSRTLRYVISPSAPRFHVLFCANLVHGALTRLVGHTPPWDTADALGGTISDGTTRSKPLRHATELVAHNEDHDITRLMKGEE